MKRRKDHQGYNDRLDESLGMRHRGPHHQSLEDRRHESEGEAKEASHHEFMEDKGMDKEYRHHMAHAHHKYMANKHRRAIHGKRK